MKKILILGIIMITLLNCNNQTKEIPWDNKPSIYEYIKSNIANDGKLSEKGQKLPDDERRFKDNELRWVPGAMDGVIGTHFGENNKVNSKLFSLTKKISIKNLESDKIKAYNILIKDNIMDYIDPTLEKILNKKIYKKPYFYKMANWLAFESPDRGAVKYGIALLGLMNKKDDISKLLILGKHEEFTLYVSVAITNTQTNPEQYLWELAKSVDGWGKISIVERLANTNNKEIKKWMIIDGYRNSIMNQYLAYICANTGELKTELSKKQVSKDILKGSGEIIEALIAGGPVEDINDYIDAAFVIEQYVNKTINNTETLSQFLILNTIKIYLENEELDWNSLEKNGWSTSLKVNLLKTINKQLQDQKWKQKVNELKNTKDNVLFWEVNQVASILNIDLWDIHWKRLNEDPIDSNLWYNIMQNSNENRIDNILDYAIKNIPLNMISTGAEDNLGLGEGYKLHNCLDYILQELNRYPGKGDIILQTALKSPVTRNRNMAINIINNWDKKYITNEMINSIKDAEIIEPNKETKIKLKQLLN